MKSYQLYEVSSTIILDVLLAILWLVMLVCGIETIVSDILLAILWFAYEVRSSILLDVLLAM